MAWQLALSAAVVTCSLLKISMDCMNCYPIFPKKTDNFGRDCFDELPDDILALLESYLSAQDVAKLRILSPSWRYLNATGPVMTFGLLESLCKKYDHIRPCVRCNKRNLERFVRLVNQYIKYWKGQRIDTFIVRFCLGSKSASEIDRWIKFAVRMGVQQLELFCGCFVSAAYDESKRYPVYTFSFQLLSEASRLRSLRLRGCKLKTNFNGQFHSLRVLDLQYVLLSQREVRRILLNCSNLEELRLSRCKCPPSLSIDGPLLQLKYLLLKYLFGPKKVELSAPKLTRFDYYNVEPIELNFVQVPNLEEIHVAVSYDKATYYVYDDLSRHAPRLQLLAVNGPVFLGSRVPSCPITFRNVIKLEFYFSSFTSDLHNVVYLLRTCPLVQSLQVMMLDYLYREDAGTMAQLQRTIHNHLEVIEFGGFYGSETQIELVIYLLETAVGLKRMDISSFGKVNGYAQRFDNVDFDEDKREPVIKRLLGKAASKSAKVSLECFPIAI